MIKSIINYFKYPYSREVLEIEDIREKISKKDTFGQMVWDENRQETSSTIIKIHECIKRYGTVFKKDLTNPLLEIIFMLNFQSYSSKYKYHHLNLREMVKFLERKYYNKKVL